MSILEDAKRYTTGIIAVLKSVVKLKDLIGRLKSGMQRCVDPALLLTVNRECFTSKEEFVIDVFDPIVFLNIWIAAVRSPDERHFGPINDKMSFVG